MTLNGHISFVHNKRKGNKIVKFTVNYNNMAIEYFEDQLITKMIPRSSYEFLINYPIKIITTFQGHALLYQDLGCSLKFLTLNDKTGKIVPIAFEDLTPQEDSIICQEESGRDKWYLDDVDSTFMLFYDDREFNNLKSAKIDTQDASDEFKKIELATYILASKHGGIILNNIMVI